MSQLLQCNATNGGSPRKSLKSSVRGPEEELRKGECIWVTHNITG